MLVSFTVFAEMFAIIHVAGTVLQVTFMLNTDNKDGIIEAPVTFRSFGVTLLDPEVLPALNFAIKLTTPSYDIYIYIYIYIFSVFLHLLADLGYKPRP